MAQALAGFMDQKVTFPDRGERVALWVEKHMQTAGLGLTELAFRVGADKRDLQRLLRERSCGHRLEDRLAAHFRWDFVEQVMTPVIGADPLTAREAELETRMAEAAAIHARLERERAVRAAHGPGDAGRDRAHVFPRALMGSSAGALNSSPAKGA